jgi:hypothetical protein
MRLILSLFLVAISLTGCSIHCEEPEPDEQCINASFIAYSCCSGTSLFELDPTHALGDAITLNGVTYQNAVQIAGKYEDDAHLKLRAFDPESDAEKRSQECWCVQAEPWHALPLYVAMEICTNNFVE